VGVDVVDVAASGGLRLHGSLALEVRRPDGTLRERREGDNIMCTNGLSALAAALVWSGIQDQAANLGVTSPTYLTPLYGAVGSGSGTVAASDVALFTELGRQSVGAGAFTPANPIIPAGVTWLFYFGNPPVNWTVTEAGVFAAAGPDADSGTMVDHWAFSPPVSVPTADTLILQMSLSIAGT
jgi:hypothetical protein